MRLSKKFTLVVILVMLAGYSPRTEAQTWGYHYEKIEYQCEICGKSLYQNTKIREGFYDNMSFGGYDGSIWIPDSIRADTYNLNLQIEHICKDCKDKYGKELDAYLKEDWNMLLAKYKKENACNRYKNDLKRKKETLENLDKQIEQLRKQKQEQLEFYKALDDSPKHL